MARGLAIVLLLLLTPLAAAQQPDAPGVVPSVEVECPGEASLSVHPTFNSVASVTCTAINDSSFAEQVSFDLDAGALTVAGPESLSIPASGSVEFDVSFRGTEGMDPSTITASVTAQVEKANGVDVSQLGISDSANINVTIETFSMVWAEVADPFIALEAGGFVEGIVVDVDNQGNAQDAFEIRFAPGSDSEATALASDLNISFAADRLELAQDASGTFQISVAAGNALPDGNIELRFEVFSVEDPRANQVVILNVDMTAKAPPVTDQVFDTLTDKLPKEALYGGAAIGALVAIFAIVLITRRLRSLAGHVQAWNEARTEAFDFDDDDDFEDDEDFDF